MVVQIMNFRNSFTTLLNRIIAMPSSDYSDSGGKGESLRRLSQLDAQRKEAGEIVQRWFRFRARRGIGITYLLLSFLPLLGSILFTLSKTLLIEFAGVTVAAIFFWSLGRLAGAQSFGKMSKTIWLLKEDSTKQSGVVFSQDIRFIALFWPWLAYATANILGLPLYEVLFATIWLVQLVLYRALTVHRNKNPILEVRVEDWLVILAFAIAAIGSSLHIIPDVSPFLLITPLILGAGLKSLYEAPKELVNSRDE